MRRQRLRDGLRQYELKTVERCEPIRCGRVVEHGAHVAGGETDEHGVINKTSFVNGASVDDVAVQSRDLSFGFSPPLAKSIQVLGRPMFELQLYFGVIVERKPVLQAQCGRRPTGGLPVPKDAIPRACRRGATRGRIHVQRRDPPDICAKA